MLSRLLSKEGASKSDSVSAAVNFGLAGSVSELDIDLGMYVLSTEEVGVIRNIDSFAI